MEINKKLRLYKFFLKSLKSRIESWKLTGHYDYLNKILGSCKEYLRKGKNPQILKAALMLTFIHVALNKMGQKLNVCNL